MSFLRRVTAQKKEKEKERIKSERRKELKKLDKKKEAKKGKHYKMKQTIVEHLSELRKRLLHSFLVFIILFLVLYVFSDKLISWLVDSVLRVANVRIINLTMIEFFSAKIKIAFIFAFFLSLPILIYHIVEFVRPALTKREKGSLRQLWFYAPFSLLLFGCSVIFFYFSFYRIILPFLATLSLKIRVYNYWSLTKLIDTIMIFLLPIAIGFQLPIISIFLFKAGVISKDSLSHKRRFFYVFIFILAAILTPPDVVSQLIVALPIVLLFELSNLVLKIIAKVKGKNERRR